MMRNFRTQQTTDNRRTVAGFGPGRRASRATFVAALALGVGVLGACASGDDATPGGEPPASSSAGPSESSQASMSESGPASSPAESSADASSTESSPAESSPAESSPAESSPAESSPAAAPAPDGLDGFLFTSISAEGRELVEGKPLTISFSTGGANGVGLKAGCNGMGGTPEFTGSGTTGSITVPQIIGTMMACTEDGVMEQEQWYSKWMTAGVDYELKGDTLELSGDGVTVVFERTGPVESQSSGGEATVTSTVAGSQPDQSSAATPSADGTIPATPATIVTPTSVEGQQSAPLKTTGGHNEIGPPKVPEN